MTDGWETDLEKYVNYLKANGKTGRYINTMSVYLVHLGKRFDKPYLEITRDEFHEWFAELSEKGTTGKKGLAESSMRGVLGRTRACLRFLNHALTPDNIRGLNYGKPRKRIRGNDELLTDDEIKTLGNAFKQPWKTVFLTLAHIGARPSEVLALQPGDVEGPQTEDGTTFFTIYFRETKTDAPRQSTVFDPQAIQALTEFMQILAPKKGYIFPRETEAVPDEVDDLERPALEGDGGKYRLPKETDVYNTAIKRVTKRLGWTKNVFPYLTRHTYVTKLRELGYSDSDIMEQCGFSDHRMLKNYGTPKPEALRRRMAKKLAPEPSTDLVVAKEDLDARIREAVDANLANMADELNRRASFVLQAIVQNANDPEKLQLLAERLGEEMMGERTHFEQEVQALVQGEEPGSVIEFVWVDSEKEAEVLRAVDELDPEVSVFTTKDSPKAVVAKAIEQRETSKGTGAMKLAYAGDKEGFDTFVSAIVKELARQLPKGQQEWEVKTAPLRPLMEGETE